MLSASTPPRTGRPVYAGARVTGRLASYLGKLPRGLDSYPDYEVKASLLRALVGACPPLTGLDFDGALGELLREAQERGRAALEG